MFDKVNITKIIRDHFGTFKDHSSKESRPLDFLLFFLVPFIVAVVIVILHGALPKGLIGVIVTSLSIFTALLLNLLLLAYNVIRNSKPPPDEKIRLMREELFHEIFSNIAFAVLVALVIVVSVLCLGMIDGSASLPAVNILGIVINILSFLIYFLGTLFLLTLLMLLKRVYSLLSKEQVSERSPKHRTTKLGK